MEEDLRKFLVPFYGVRFADGIYGLIVPTISSKEIIYHSSGRVIKSIPIEKYDENLINKRAKTKTIKRIFIVKDVYTNRPLIPDRYSMIDRNVWERTSTYDIHF